MTTALTIVGDAYADCNRLSPGETLDADDAARGLDKLNIIVDEWSAQQPFLYQSIFTSVVQTGNITLATGSWAAIAVGAEILGIWQNDLTVSELTPSQFGDVYTPIQTGAPQFYMYDGKTAISFSPTPTGQTIKILTGKGVTAFADLTTDYTMPPGYRAALGKTLAEELAPIVMAQVPAKIIKDAEKARFGIRRVRPAILDVSTYASPQPRANILNGW